ncbi:hypothetical protein ACHAW5_000887 [Stephanodiscus triporus]|uniref:peptidylprolyl isomerase n=1 Tax=Stephanodiscus triporus TaxID=2934178 RepID=A0ABD3NL34_9STRA
MSPKSSNKKTKREVGPPPPPPSSSSSSSFIEKYRGATLDELSVLDDAHDEEIDEDEAFDAEDEAAFRRRMSSPKIRSGNVTLSVPLTDDLMDDTRDLEIARGSKMTLSAACLDVNSCNFQRARLMYRCVYPKEHNGNAYEFDNDFVCLCNYLSAKDGGIGLMPCTPIGLEVVGPCRVEFQGDVDELSEHRVQGTINIFGIVVPLSNQDGDVDVYERVPSFRRAGALSIEGERVAIGAPTGDDGNAGEGGEVAASKKRKLENDANVAPPKQPPSDSRSGDRILTKKERKKLAREKAEQLEETLSAARNEVTSGDAAATDNKPAKEKSKKEKSGGPNDDSDRTASSKPTSLTRERRLDGGLIVSDVLQGVGAPVRPGKRISLHYTGFLRSTGKIFDRNNSKQHPLVFRQGTGEVIRGLERGLEGMKVGGERIITIPSKLGYGSKGSGEEIPPDADLVFEVKLLKVG